MIILDEPYASDLLLDWMEASAHPVLENDFIKKCAGGRVLNTVSAVEAVERIDAGERLYTNSENTLAWIVENTHNTRLINTIEMFKDKASIRSVLSELDPDYFFETCSLEQLYELEFDALKVPFVLKPSVGFCSMGVYTIKNEKDWNQALEDIKISSSSWKDMYPESVIGANRFILEEYIEGTEYAIDAYFDDKGRAHVLNLLRHDFASDQDTSDRMYLTSSSMVREMEGLFTEWLNAINEIIGARNFPVHPEVRVKDGRVRFIEFNPLRFCGLGGTDVAFYGYGHRTYESFLNDNKIDLKQVFSDKDDTIFVMSLLNPPVDATGEETFDYDSFTQRFANVLEMRPFKANRVGSYGFLFLKVDVASRDELDFLMHSDLKEFLRTSEE